MSLLTKPISFCDRIAYNVVDADFKARTLQELDERYRCGVLKRHYDRFDPNATPARLGREPHLACLRSNGNPYYLFLTKSGDKRMAIFIDKKVQSGYAQPRMIVAAFQMRADLFRGTVLEGEMVRDEMGDWVFLVNDVLGSGGRRNTEPLASRLKVATRLLEEDYTPSLLDVCAFQVKRYVPAHLAMEELVQGLVPSLTYSNRGLLFKPVRGSLLDTLYNFDDAAVKTPAPRAKLSKDRVVADLAELVGELPPEVPSKTKGGKSKAAAVCATTRELRVVRGAEPDTYHVVGEQAMLRVATLAQSRELRAAFEGLPISRPVTVQCAWDERFKKWTLTGSCSRS